ncbi:hypothetical protein ABZ942_39370 [Nocardia sp. NPDC046473]|uniref:hypothetical protein n=1 Tax=Nocardia sp. NPDC046473 TaxID=3155733 RepID=UPI00340A8C2E
MRGVRQAHKSGSFKQRFTVSFRDRPGVDVTCTDGGTATLPPKVVGKGCITDSGMVG